MEVIDTVNEIVSEFNEANPKGKFELKYIDDKVELIYTSKESV